MGRKSSHRFAYRWKMEDGYPSPGIQYHGKKVFGTFICGGGSSMGYKLAGYNHLGGVEIDPKVAEIYRTNHKPEYLFEEDIRTFNSRKNFPDSLSNLDLLDGSPPCSTFSSSGSREKAWGKKKKFREGQSEQRLDDLVFRYIDTISILKPKVAILENVKGLVLGSAKAYAKRIKTQFEDSGYRVQVFLLNAASMGVPQKRERVFFVGLREDLNLPLLKLDFKEPAIPFGQFMEKNVRRSKATELTESVKKRLPFHKRGEMDLGPASQRMNGKLSFFNSKFAYPEKVSLTIASAGGSRHIVYGQDRTYTTEELCQIGTYPIDYNFKGMDPQYLIGMSVPPVMTAQISYQIYRQWLSRI